MVVVGGFEGPGGVTDESEVLPPASPHRYQFSRFSTDPVKTTFPLRIIATQ